MNPELPFDYEQTAHGTLITVRVHGEETNPQVTLSRLKRPGTPALFRVTSLFVPPAARKIGLATALLAEAERIAKAEAEGPATIFLECRPFIPDEETAEGPDHDKLFAWYYRKGYRSWFGHPYAMAKKI